MARATFPPFPQSKDDFARALLRSAEADEPSSAAYAKAATALGVGAGLGVGASLAAPSLVAASAAGAARWSGLTALRLWAVTMSGALVVGGGALFLAAQAPRSGANQRSAGMKQGTALHVPAPAQEVAPTSALPLAVQASSAPSLAPERPQPEVELDADELAAEAVARAASAGLAPVLVPGSEPVSASPLIPHASGSGAVRRAARSSALSSGSSTSSGSSLAEQVQSLDRARVALGSGDASTALAEIAHYRKAWPQGVFLTEASVLEIEALASRGERSLAASRAAAFVAAHPDSPQAERLRRLIPAQ